MMLHEVREFINNEGYELHSIISRNSLWLRCPKGHLFETTFDKFYSNPECCVCGTNVIKFEKYKSIKEYQLWGAVKEYIKSV